MHIICTHTHSKWVEQNPQLCESTTRWCGTSTLPSCPWSTWESQIEGPARLPGHIQQRQIGCQHPNGYIHAKPFKNARSDTHTHTLMWLTWTWVRFFPAFGAAGLALVGSQPQLGTYHPCTPGKLARDSDKGHLFGYIWPMNSSANSIEHTSASRTVYYHSECVLGGVIIYILYIYIYIYKKQYIYLESQKHIFSGHYEKKS